MSFENLAKCGGVGAAVDLSGYPVELEQGAAKSWDGRQARLYPRHAFPTPVTESVVTMPLSQPPEMRIGELLGPETMTVCRG